MPYPRRFSFVLIPLIAALTLALSGCNYADIRAAMQAAATPSGPEHLVPKVLSVKPHDTTSYTEGLLLYNGYLYESTGQLGHSKLIKEDPQTGKALVQVRLSDKDFGEGLALVGNHLIQLTWQEGIAYVYDVNSFARVGTFSYTGEGWGLCYDGKDLYMDNGSNNIYTRDPTTFDVTHFSPVLLDDQPVKNLNELECVGDSLYVNVWLTNTILRLDKATGRVTAVIDATGLLKPEEISAAGPDGVLNGIAYDPTHADFLITGKYWPWMFEVQFVPKS